MITIWDFALLIAIALGITASVAIYKLAIKPIFRAIKNRKKLKESTETETKTKKHKRFKNKTKIAEDDLFEESAKNLIFTTENYNLATKNKRFQKNQEKERKLSNTLEITEDASKRKAKKLYKTQHKIDKAIRTEEQTNNTENLQFDYVKNSDKGFDNLTYIQVFDEERAEEFKKLAEADDTKGSPYVYKIEFNKASGKQPLRLSTPNLNIYLEGKKLLIDKIGSDLMDIVESGEPSLVKSMFPLTETCRYKDKVYKKTFNTTDEYIKHFYSEGATEEEEKTK